MITITPGGLIDMRYYSNSVTHLFVLPSLIANRLIQEPMIDPEPFFDQLTVLAPLLDAICFSKLAPSAGRINELLEIFDYKTEGQQVPSVPVDSPLASDLIQIAGIIEPALKQIALACALLKVKPDLLDDLATINERIKTLTITTTAFNPEDLILTERLIQMLSQTQPINDRKAQDNANWIKPQAALATLISEASQTDLQHLALDLIKENIQSAATTR
jgi:glycerol-3-phosphate O-acyltransferase